MMLGSESKQQQLPGECHLYFDFANHYNDSGEKVALLAVFKVSDVSQDDLKSADVLDHHPQGPFQRFQKIHVSGDHGPHFTCHRTSPGHAYNRCDQSGAEIKRLLEASYKASDGECNASDIADLLNRG
jgi:hypothetical protein